VWYVLEDTVPANTSYANRRTTEIKVAGGILHTIYARIYAGNKSAAKFQLKADNYVILPRNEDKWITGDNLNFEFREWLELKTAENDLQLVTWNDSTRYAHEIVLLIGILPKSVIEIEEQYLKNLRMFMSLFRRRT
jgi:hypothetical protein